MHTNNVNHLLNFVESCHEEIDADNVVTSFLDFTTKFTFGGVMQDHRGCLDVFCNVIKAPATNNLTIAEYTLTACHLSVEQLSPDRIPFAITAEWTANGGQEHIRHVDDPCAIFDWFTEALYS